MDSQQLAAYVRDHWIVLLLINLGIGIILGLIPFFLGRRRGSGSLSSIALIVTALLSIPSFLLGVVSAIAFTLIILMKRSSPE